MAIPLYIDVFLARGTSTAAAVEVEVVTTNLKPPYAVVYSIVLVVTAVV